MSLDCMPANLLLDDLLPLPMYFLSHVARGLYLAQQQTSMEDYLELSVMLQYNFVH